jgi:hypothetical protein
VADPSLATGLSVAAALQPPLAGQVALITTTATGDVVLALGSGAHALLGPPTDLGDKLLSLTTMVTRVQVGQGTIDVRVPTAPVLTAGAPPQ